MYEAVDRLFQEIMGNDKLFGGKPILLGGDFRQIPLVLRYIDRDSVAAHTLVALPWWQSGQVKRFPLAANVRAQEDAAYASFCLHVGNGSVAFVWCWLRL